MNDLLPVKGAGHFLLADIGTVLFRHKGEDDDSDHKQNDQTEHRSRGFPGQLGGNGNEQRPHN